MQSNYEAPVTGSVVVDLNVAQVVADFLLIMLQIPDSPLNRDQLEQFSNFREVVKAGPVELTQRSKPDDVKRMTSDGIVIGNGPKMMMDRTSAIKFLRATMNGTMTDELKGNFMANLVDGIASRGPKQNAGINGKFCSTTLGNVDPHEAALYLSGRVPEILVTRAKTAVNCMPVYTSDAPNHYIPGASKPWTGPKDHVKTKFTDEEQKNFNPKVS